MGYTAEELLAIPWMDLIHPDDRTRTCAGVDDLGRGREVFQLLIRGICRDGSARWLQWNCRGVPQEGLIYAAPRDVTDVYRAAQEQAAFAMGGHAGGSGRPAGRTLRRCRHRDASAAGCRLRRNLALRGK